MQIITLKCVLIVHVQEHLLAPSLTCDGPLFSLLFLYLCFLSSQVLFRFELLVWTSFFFSRALLNKLSGGVAFVGFVDAYPEVLVHVLIFSSICLSRTSSALSTNMLHSGNWNARYDIWRNLWDICLQPKHCIHVRICNYISSLVIMYSTTSCFSCPSL